MALFTMKSFTAAKSDADEGQGGHTLARHLSATHLTLMGIAGIIGAGIFVLTGTAAAHYAGPGVILSFIVSGIACLFAGLCYAEYASMVPVSGSAYTYAYTTLGEMPAWIVGWALVLEYLFASATIAVGWSGYFVEFMGELGWHIPPALANSPYITDASGKLIESGAIINLPAMAMVAILSTILYVGIKESTKFTNLMVYVKLTVVLLVIGFGFMYVNPDNWSPLIPEPTGVPGQYGWDGVMRGAAVVFFAYIGFDMVSTSAQEAKNPQRDLPLAIIGSLLICTVLYIGMAAVMTGLAHYTELAVPHPVFVAISKAGDDLAWLGPIINIGAIAGLASASMVTLYGQSRVFYVMSHDGLLPKFFGAVHPKYKTPYLSTVLVAFAAGAAGGLLPIGLLGEIVSLGTLLAFVVACIGVLVLRYTRPELERPFKTPLFPLVPILGILSCGYLMISLPGDTWIRGAIWMVIGLVIYFIYGFKNSKAAQAEAA